MSRAQVTGVILSGGQGSRMGNADKGLQPYQGRLLIAHVIARFAPQVTELLISANRNIERYREFGYEVLLDDAPSFEGPLAGVQRALRAARFDYLATAPCDVPHLPLDLVDRLHIALADQTVDVAVARTSERVHPVLCLMRTRVRPSLDVYLDGGGRKLRDWFAKLHVAEVPFDDTADAFKNYNTLDALNDAR